MISKIEFLDYTIEEREATEVLNPATNEVVGKISMATEGDADKAIERANEAQKQWKATPVWKRGEILNRFANLVEEKSEEIARTLSLESGKIIREAESEVVDVSRLFRNFVEKARHVYGENIPLDYQPGLENDIFLTRREPLGVIVGIVPFNYPTEIFSQKVAPALSTGNTIIIKAPQDTPLAILKLEELLYEAGLPENVLQVINGSGRVVGQRLVSSPNINAVSLTGGTDTGIAVSTSAIKQLNRVALELGGNDPLIVFEDANVEEAVKQAVAGRIPMNGQTCIANKRLIVHESIKEQFTKLLVEEIKDIKLGNPQEPDTDMGPLINEGAVKTVHEQVEHTIFQGAKLLLGGEIVDYRWYKPTVLTDVTPDFDIAQDMEVFGPVFPIIGFKDDEEAVEIANNSIYGLNGALFTKDVNRAMNIGYQIESSIVSVNGASAYRPDVAYFGGYKMSGYTGNEGLMGAIQGMTQVKNLALRNSLNIYNR